MKDISDILHKNHKQTEIKVRSYFASNGKEVIGAFIDSEEVAKQIDRIETRDIWMLNITASIGQKMWSALVGLHLVGVHIRKVRYGQIPQFSLDNGMNWDELTDGKEARMWIEVERRIFMPVGKDGQKAVSPSAETRRMVMDCLMESQVDPVKDWLNDLPPWDGIERLDTNMSDQGMTIAAKCEIESGKTIDFTRAAQSYLPLEIVRLTYYPGAQRNPMLVLRGKGGEGKSSYGQRVLPPHLQEKDLYTADYKLTMNAQKAGQLLSKIKVNEMREFGINKHSDLDEVKSNAMASTADFRIPWGRRPVTLQRHDACYITTNQGNLPTGDPALHRRFWYCNVIRQTKLVNGVAWTAFDEKIEGTDHTLRDQIFAEAKNRIMSAEKPEAYSEIPALKPEEFMEYNMRMGGTYDTPGEDFQENADEAISQLIESGIKEVTMRDMKAAIVCVEYSKPIVNAAEIERIAESTSLGEITRAGAKEMINTMRNHRNDKVKRAVKRNSETRNDETPGIWRYEWKRGKYQGEGSKRMPPQFEMIGDVSPEGEEVNPFE